MLSTKKVKRIFLYILGAYVVFALAFYYLAGDQLRYRNSRENIAMLPAETAIEELRDGIIIEQSFSTRVQRIEKISVLWGTYYRANFGNMTMSLVRESDSFVLAQSSFDVSTIGENQILSIEFEQPLEDLCNVPLIIRTQSDSAPGASVTPMVNLSSQGDPINGSLNINGDVVDGRMCFSVEGEEYIWTGLHYWTFAGILFVILGLFLFIQSYVYEKKGNTRLIGAINAAVKYKFLIKQLVSRDFKTKYRRSILGMFWSFLNPLMMMVVQYFVFSTIFKSDINHYPAYLIIGIVSFNFFSEACGLSLVSVLGNANLIKKVYMPKYIYPLTRTMSSSVNFGISLIPLSIVAFATGVHFHKSTLLAFFFWACLIVFCIGLGMLLASSMVFFRDTQFLWGVLSTIWMYATPIFYPESILPDNFKFVLRINPLYYFLKSVRMCILDGLSPEPRMYFSCAIMALSMLCFGAFIFKKTQDKFVLYL